MSLPTQLTLVSPSTLRTCHYPHNWHWCPPLHRWHVTTLTIHTGVYLYTEDMSLPSQLTLVSTSTLRTCPHPHNWHWCLPYTEDMSLPSQLTLVSTSRSSTQKTCPHPHNWHWCLLLHWGHVTTLTIHTGVYLYTEDMSPPSQITPVSTST